MAKSARSSRRKANNAALRARVFGPVDEARTNRLSAKLMALAAQPKPTERTQQQQDNEAMEVETELRQTTSHAANNPDRSSEDMDIDENADTAKPTHKKSPLKRSNRIQKKRAGRRAKSSTTFPNFRSKAKGNTAAGKQGKKTKH